MRIPRIYHPEPLQINTTISLGDDAANHVGRVLRMTAGQKLELFDGSNQTFSAEITEATKKNVFVHIENSQIDDRESPLDLHLGQVMSRGEKMEFTIQKSVELGVNTITPLLSERCGVRLDGERLEKNYYNGKKLQLQPVNNAAATEFQKFAQCKPLKPGARKLTVHLKSICTHEQQKVLIRYPLN